MQEYLNLRGKRVTVMGLGHFGGGVGAVRFLTERGARVTVTDLLSAQDLQEPLSQLEGCPLEALHLGGHEEADFRDADMVIANPAVPHNSPFLELARRANVELTSEISLFWRLNRGRVIGVTGSNGKSTTAAMIHAIIEASGQRCWLGGNIGRSLLDVVDQIQPDDWVVLELSSFQLFDLDRLFSSPEIAVVTNFAPNHLDWHGCLKSYEQSKQSILRWQTDHARAVVNQDDPRIMEWPVNGARLLFGSRDSGQSGTFGTPEGVLVRGFEHLQDFAPDEGGERNGLPEVTLPVTDWLRVPGEHNVRNALAAICATMAAAVPVSAIRQGLEQFDGLPHRLQFVAEVNGRKFYNDSLATTPESVGVALDSFSEPIVLLAGGYDKQIDLSGLADQIAQKAKAATLMGQTAEELADLIAPRISERPSLAQPVPIQQAGCLEEAFQWAVEQSAPGDVILLSPGCASYDWFRNFAERGERFAQLVANYETGRLERQSRSEQSSISR